MIIAHNHCHRLKRLLVFKRHDALRGDKVLALPRGAVFAVVCYREVAAFFVRTCHGQRLRHVFPVALTLVVLVRLEREGTRISIVDDLHRGVRVLPHLERGDVGRMVERDVPNPHHKLLVRVLVRVVVQDWQLDDLLVNFSVESKYPELRRVVHVGRRCEIDTLVHYVDLLVAARRRHTEPPRPSHRHHP